MLATLQLPTMQYDPIPLEGGLDQVTSSLKLKPGVLRDGLNFECAITGGYTRIYGYERFDGRAKPSDATYSLVQVESFTNLPSLGQTLTGGTTGTTGVIIALGGNYMIVTLIVGAGFSLTEALAVGATPIGTATTPTVSLTSLQNAQFLNLAADVYRALIAVVPGSGAVRGVFGMNNAGVHEVFAFRDNAGATACVLHKASTSGWTAVTMFSEVSFTVGSHASLVPLDGDTLTQGANTATIKRVMLQSGTFAAGTAAGRFIVTTPAPGNFGAGAATIGAITLTLSGIQTAITILPGGKYETDYANFSGQLTTRRIYGADNVNRCFEFDGITFAPITTGLTVDTPRHIKEHQSHLFISLGSSAINSGIGTPFNWTALAGGAEHAVGDTVTGLKVQPGAESAPAMLITSRNSSKILYGSSATGDNPFQLVSLQSEVGAVDYSLQNLDQTYLLDDRGVQSMRAGQDFGNFATATFTFPLLPFIQEKRSLLNYSCVNKDKSQYRLFFSDGSGLYSTIVNGKHVGSIPVRFPQVVTCAWNGELANGNEVTYVGASNGMVYQLDRGSSFDGTEIEAYVTLNWANQRTPRIKKSYRRASLETQGNSYASVNFEYTLGYGSAEYAQQGAVAYASGFRGAPVWDSGILWDQFTWDGMTLGPIELEMSGTAENVQARFSNNTDYVYPFTLNTLTVHYFMRRGLR